MRTTWVRREASGQAAGLGAPRCHRLLIGAKKIEAISLLKVCPSGFAYPCNHFRDRSMA